jgi:hypothetical protein
MSALDDPKLLATLIACLGVVVSAFTSVVISRLTAQESLKQLKMELAQKYTDHLYQKRLKVYPSLYSIVSATGKIVLRSTVKYADLHRLLIDIESWDTRNAVYVSTSIANLLLVIRKSLIRFRTSNPDATPDDTEIKVVFRSMIALETALKQELGVFAADDYHNDTVIKRIAITLPISKGGNHDEDVGSRDQEFSSS